MIHPPLAFLIHIPNYLGCELRIHHVTITAVRCTRYPVAGKKTQTEALEDLGFVSQMCFSGSQGFGLNPKPR